MSLGAGGKRSTVLSSIKPPAPHAAIMQRPDEHKRQLIIDTAGRFFATQPFHKVRLDDIAAAAKLGKGTLYIYFDSKEDLYFSLIYEGFAKLVDQLRGELAGEQLRLAVE